jgi:hypothetical protein
LSDVRFQVEAEDARWVEGEFLPGADQIDIPDTLVEAWLFTRHRDREACARYELLTVDWLGWDLSWFEFGVGNDYLRHTSRNVSSFNICSDGKRRRLYGR